MTKRVLIIDDEETIQTVVKFGIKITAGWEVLTASSALEGIEIAEAEQPDVILLDVMMPDIDGIATLKALQADVRTHHIPVIFLTAHAQPSSTHSPQAPGVRGHIVKPFNSLELPGQIAAILHWSLR